MTGQLHGQILEQAPAQQAWQLTGPPRAARDDSSLQ